MFIEEKERVRPFVGADPHRWVGNLTKRPRLLAAADLDDGMLPDVTTGVHARVAAKRATFTPRQPARREAAGTGRSVLRQPADRVAVAERTATYAAG